MQRMIRVTAEIIQQGTSRNGGLSREQTDLLGVDVTVRGWKQRAIGKELPAEVVERFLSLKDAHLWESGACKKKRDREQLRPPSLFTEGG